MFKSSNSSFPHVSEENTGDEENSDIKGVVNALYQACHIQAPLVFVARSKKEYSDYIRQMSLRRGINGLLICLFTAMIISIIPICLHELFGLEPLAGISLDFWVSYFFTISTILVLLITELSLSDLGYFLRVHIKKTSFLPKQARKQKAKATSASMMGCLNSAIAAHMNKPPGNVVYTSREWNDICLRIGSNITTSKSRNVWYESIADFVSSWLSRSSLERGLLPVVLQRACDLACLVDEIYLLDGVAIAIKTGFIENSRKPLVFSRLDRIVDLSVLEKPVMEECRKVLGNRPMSMEHLEHLVREVLNWTDLSHKEAVYRAVGIKDVVDMLDIKPAQQDESGSLYRISNPGLPSSVICFVRLEDKVHDGNGHALLHWLSVPQYISSAHEGVAWSFSLSDSQYSPTAEA